MPDLVRLMRPIAAEEQPDDPSAGQQAEVGLVRAVEAGGLLMGDRAWVLGARVDGEPAGYALACRVLKLDQRVGFLFVDER